MVILYFNTKIGSNNIGYEEVMGTHGIGEMNEKGEMFADCFSWIHQIDNWRQCIERRTNNRVSPGSNLLCYRFKIWAFTFSPRRPSPLSCINEYLSYSVSSHFNCLVSNYDLVCSLSKGPKVVSRRHLHWSYHWSSVKTQPPMISEWCHYRHTFLSVHHTCQPREKFSRDKRRPVKRSEVGFGRGSGVQMVQCELL